MLNYLKNNNFKVGILGGSFDPPHIGHIKISKTAIKRFKLNYVIWIITKKNPLKKKPLLDIKKRINLSKKILKKEKKIKIEFLEPYIKSNTTYSLLKFIKKNKKHTKLFLIIGADNLIFFHKWNKWKQISKIAKILVFDRQNYKTKALKSVASKNLKSKDLTFIKFKKINISSSKIKKNW